MSLFKFTHEWASAGQDIPEIYYTMTNLALHVGDINLMQNEDVWAKTIRDAVLVSSYPLAMWLAASWWRLNFETLSASPSIDWRMAHEMGAANHGFVWPKVLFASDREFMQIWAAPSNANSQQSVRYLNGLDRAAFVKLTDFQRSVETFITSVLNRLDAVDCHNTDLWQLWQLIQEDRADLQRSNYRRLEAELGYDPDECSEIMMIKAQILEKQMGTETFSELAPIYGRVIGDSPLTAIEQIINSPGLIG